MPLRIAVSQQNHNPGQVEENRTKALAFAAAAIDDGAEIILFHEEMLVGYVENGHDLTEEVDGPTSQAFQQLLSEKNSDSKIVYGLTEKAGDDYYISAPVVTRDGVIANYRKCHLFAYDTGLRHEPSFYKAGNELVCFEHGNNKIGIMICFDGDYPEMARAYAQMGCSVLLWMNNRSSRGPDDEVRDTAKKNSLIMATTCCVGVCERSYPCSGGSNICNYDGTVLAELWNDEGFKIADVDPAAALEHRQSSMYFASLRPDLYARYD
ncbi:MAG: carbon-nitrogen hydrolase family protein [Planctomycetes bacterium]|nr:carbon-nitrogen hydrolase family protein [Planctomycetota bacterium]